MFVVLPVSVVLLLGVGSAVEANPLFALDPVWDLTMPNHGGGAVATSERWTVIGGPQWGPGGADDPSDFDLRDYVYVVTEPGGDIVETLVGSDTEPGDRFGYDVGVSGDLVVVGAPDADEGRGAVYVFSLADAEVTETKLSPVATDNGEFGNAVAIDGTRLVATVGSEVEVFDLVAGTWMRSKLPPVGTDGGLSVPATLAIEGDTVVVGRPSFEPEGVLDVYTKTTTGWTAERLVASDSDDVFGYTGFGAAVDIAGDCLIAGAPNTFVGAGYMGGAYVFCRTATAWSETKLNVPEQTNDDGFGTSVALLGDYYAVVGAPKHDTNAYNSGSVYVFTRLGDTWAWTATLNPPLELTVVEGGYGTAVDIIGNRLVVGASGRSEPAAVGSAFGLVGPFDGRFCDDDNSIFEPDIEKLAAAGITKGCDPPSNLRFCPGDPVTRGELAAFLVRALDPTATGSTNFTDDDGSVFEADIEKLAAAGITRGCNPPVNDQYCPNANVTREQMAAFLVRALGLTDNTSPGFVDDDNSVFEIDIEKLATAGITRGCNPPANDRFCPTDPVTRGQMAAFLSRALGL